MAPAGDGTIAASPAPALGTPVSPPSLKDPPDAKSPFPEAASPEVSKEGGGRGRCVALVALLVVLTVLAYGAAFSLAWVFFFAAPLPPLPAPLVTTESPNPNELARFSRACLSEACPVLGEGFFFGLATASAHVEDELEDGWLDFAELGHMRYNRSDTNDTFQSAVDGPVAVVAWRDRPIPEQRLRFWTEPEVEMKLAKDAGVDALRMGIDWGRLVPVEPVNGTALIVDWSAVEHYRQMLRLAKEQMGMRVMLTLFHHSFPKWGMQFGGWTNGEKAVPYFTQLADLAVSEFGPWVDYWATFNEPSIFVLLSYCVGVWPPGFKSQPLHTAKCFSPIGEYPRSMANIAAAHNAAYDVIRAKSAAPVGVAHNTGFMVPYSAMDLAAHQYFDRMTLYPWTDQIVHKLDFLGLNYYSQEFLSVAGLQAMPDEEYSENGRAVYPDGLLRILIAFHDRYKEQYPGLRLIVTENGIADDSDIIRGPYVVEHLLAVHAAIKQGVPVDGYFHWTISDNWEWADGYCPKFGLVNVDRANNLTRIPRPSYYLYKDIVNSRVITQEVRDTQWNTYHDKALAGTMRPFCRSVDASGRMGSDSLDKPEMRPMSTKDWRFGYYQQPSLFTMYQRTAHVFNCWSRDLISIMH